MRSTTSMTLAPGCRWTFRMTASVRFIQPASLVFSAPSVAFATSARRTAVAVGDDKVLVIGGFSELVVGVDRVLAGRPVEIALRRVDIGVVDRGAQVIDVDAIGGELAQIGLDAHRRA